MLKLKPNCENCDKDLPAESIEAMICSYECTFCCDCVDNVLNNVCPNCGGGFVRRPIRPKKAWREGVSVIHHPASEKRVLKPVDQDEHRVFSRPIVDLAAKDR
ncbi:DUF1272 domain-containing protein [Aliikangiella marina]|uniref:DUF1272 domain-containing protein n=1 Tax=Aliikangiella marina TaxID=1712262 RepID=A0A545T4L3_9GAMM|nr:DUF1272 domain-containing protein [Aliikangiella marina]TQV72135.1 DUF1272 domain-containing protein [Aliikangiella marina]